MTPPPFPPPEVRNSFGKSSIFPSQSNITTSSSVQAGLANCEEIQLDGRVNLLFTIIIVIIVI